MVVMGRRHPWRRLAAPRVGTVLAWLATVILCLAVGATAFAYDSTPWIGSRITLLEAVDRGYVRAEFAATGNIGVALRMSISSLSETTLAVTVTPGLLLGCDIPGVQRLVVRSPIEFNVVASMDSDRFIELAPEETQFVELEGYCLDGSDRLPDEGTPYRLLGTAPWRVERILSESVKDTEYPGTCTLQAAVWIAQEDMTKSQFEARFGASCADINVARVVELCNHAGIIPDASWPRQMIAAQPEPEPEPAAEPQSSLDADPDPVPAPVPNTASAPMAEPEEEMEEPSSDLAAWVTLWGMVGFLVLLVKLLQAT